MSSLDYEINKELGECYLFMGELEKSEEYYLKAADSSEIYPDAYLGLATIAVQRGALDEAMDLYRRAHAIEANDRTFSGMGLIQLEAGEKEKAFENFSKALSHNPENMVALFSMVRLGHELERLDVTRIHLENYLSIDPDKNEIRYSLAGCLMCLDEKELAIEHLDIILKNDAENIPAKDLMDLLQE